MENVTLGPAKFTIRQPKNKALQLREQETKRLFKSFGKLSDKNSGLEPPFAKLEVFRLQPVAL